MVELLIVVSVSVVVLLMGASYFSGNIAIRRSVDELTNSIGTTIQLAKLQSARQGVEYRLVLASCTSVDSTDPECEICNTYADYLAGDETLNLILERGDSNIGSGNWCMQNINVKKMQSAYDIVMSSNVAAGPINVTFLPSGMRSDFRTDALVETLTIYPLGGSAVDKCGEIEVTSAGAVRAIQGRWDGTVCNAILDPEPTPGP